MDRWAETPIAVELCEVCLEEGERVASNVPAATVYCVDCSQKLCDSCSAPHRRMRTGAHDVKPLSEVTAEDAAKLPAALCSKHRGKPVELYCYQCSTNICMMCFAVEHQQHRCLEIEEAAAQFAAEIDARVYTDVVSRINDIQSDVKKADKERVAFSDSVTEVRRNVKKQGEEIKRLVDTQVAELTQQIEAMQMEGFSRIDLKKSKLETELAPVRNLQSSWERAKSSGRPSDITQAYDKVLKTINQLPPRRQSRSNDQFSRFMSFFRSHGLKVRFSPMNVEELLTVTVDGKAQLKTDGTPQQKSLIGTVRLVD